jgi:hypothetical protein
MDNTTIKERNIERVKNNIKVLDNHIQFLQKLQAYVEKLKTHAVKHKLHNRAINTQKTLSGLNGLIKELQHDVNLYTTALVSQHIPVINSKGCLRLVVNNTKTGDK